MKEIIDNFMLVEYLTIAVVAVFTFYDFWKRGNDND